MIETKYEIICDRCGSKVDYRTDLKPNHTKYQEIIFIPEDELNYKYPKSFYIKICYGIDSSNFSLKNSESVLCKKCKKLALKQVLKRV